MCAGVVLSLSGYQSPVGSRKNSSNFPLHKSTIRQKLSATRSVLGVKETASLVSYFFPRSILHELYENTNQALVTAS